MEFELKDMVRIYLNREKSHHESETVEFKKLALDEFIAYLDKVKEKGWQIDDAIRGRTMWEYVFHLERMGREPNYILNAFKSVQDFIVFGLDMGWIKEYEIWKKEKK